MVPGHPFKGGAFPFSKGMLLNPEIKRFTLSSPLFFKPVRPGAGAGDVVEEKTFVDSPSTLVKNYLGNTSINDGDKCNQYYSNLERCFNNSVKGNRDPEVHCQYYVQSLMKNSCSS